MGTDIYISPVTELDTQEWGELVITASALYFFPLGKLVERKLEEDVLGELVNGPPLRTSVVEAGLVVPTSTDHSGEAAPESNSPFTRTAC